MNNKLDRPRISQIMTVTTPMWALYVHDDGITDYLPVEAWALVEEDAGHNDGSTFQYIVALILDDEQGTLERCDTYSSFKRILRELPHDVAEAA